MALLGAEEMMVGMAAKKGHGIVRRLSTWREIELISKYIEDNGSQVSHGGRRDL